VAGIGNIFNRDDAFGVEVAQRLSQVELPEGVTVRDFGIRGFDLVLALLDGYDLTILIDVVSRGGAPGTLYAIEPDLDAIVPGEESAIENGHGLDPVKVLAMAKSLGAPLGRVVVLGCEPQDLAGDTGEIGLTAAVQAAIDGALEMVRSLVGEFNTRKEYVQ
jgi:hydrogenase maturation protease